MCATLYRIKYRAKDVGSQVTIYLVLDPPE